MKKFVLFFALIIFFFTGDVNAAKVFYRTSLTGGASTALDGANGNQLTDGDLAMVADGTDIYHYRLDDSSGAAESSPSIISPDNDAGTKRWILQNVYGATAGVIPPTGVSLTGGIVGMSLSNDTDTDHDILISAGACMDSTGAYHLSAASGITKQIDAPWTIGDDAGGILNGSVSANELYHIYALRKDSDTIVDYGFLDKDDAIGTYLPAGYSTYRWIGYVFTDSSANIRSFRMTDNIITFNEAVPRTGSYANSAIMQGYDLGGFIPSGYTKRVFISTYNAIGSAVTLGSTPTQGTTTVTANTSNAWSSLHDMVAWVHVVSNSVIYLNTGSNNTSVWIKSVEIIR